MGRGRIELPTPEPGVLIVRPKQPYLDWAATLDDSGILPDVSGEKTVYLIPEFETPEEAEEILEAVYSEVFERELNGWHTDEAAWWGSSWLHDARLDLARRFEAARFGNVWG